jgi:serine protease Do
VRFSPSRVATVALAVALACPVAGAEEPVVVAPEPAGIEAVEPAEVAAARTAVWPALVNIAVVSQSFSEGRAVRYPSAGSGVVVTPEGHVLTNYHVAGEAVRITCTLTDGRVLRARVVTDDPLTDLSVLRLESPPSAPPFAFAALGDSDRLETGDPVIAMGNPLALASSVTLGIVSNPHRVFTDFAGTRLENLELGGSPTGVFTRWIQHDALILPGNSGGPLVDLEGRVVGINELGGGFGFAIPSNIAAEVLRQAIASGEVRRGWLGFSVLPVTKLGRDRGALVSSVLPGSPAERAGLAPGDILLELGGEPVDVRFLEQIPVVYQRAAALTPGDRVEVKVERSGAERTLTAEVEAMPPARGEEGEVTALGLTLREVTEPLALLRGLPDAEGLLVTGVRPGYPAAEARPPLAADDVLLAVDGQPLPTLAAVEGAVAGAGAEHRLLAFRRGKAEMVTAVDLDRDDSRRRWGGALPEPWLGIGTQVVTPDIAEALGVAGTKGFRVTRVYCAANARRTTRRRSSRTTAN